MMVAMIRKVARFYLFKVLLYEHFRLCSSTSICPSPSLWLFNTGKHPAACGFWPCWSFGPCLLRFPRPGALACNFLNTKCAIDYFSNSLSLVRPRIFWFVMGCFCIITAVIFSKCSCKLLTFSGTLSLHREINILDEKLESWLFSYARLMRKITECEKEFLLLWFLSPKMQRDGPAQENSTTN